MYNNRSQRGGSFGRNSSGPRRFPARQNRGPGMGTYIDPMRFVNKAAVIEETTEQFVPDHQFSDFEIDARLKANIAAKGYVLPSPIQDKAIPHVLRGEDIVGIANTGTGKTAAFLVPLLDKVLRSKGERVLIIAPTRELASQIDEELRAFAKGTGLYSAICVGGSSLGKQISELRHRPEFVIGTPGRLKDLMEQRALDLSGFRTVVLDEADRMLDMGFINDMRFMMSSMSKDRHTLFFSATLSPEIDRLVGEFLKPNPARISVKTRDTAKNIDQDIVRVSGKQKVDVLSDLLSRAEFEKVLVFGRTKHGVEKLSQILSDRGIRAVSIHGNKSQPQRERALSDFKNHRAKVLVATDVAARGLDIPDVSHVVNFDVPSTYEDYVHRIGRTGRAGKKGKALTFVE